MWTTQFDNLYGGAIVKVLFLGSADFSIKTLEVIVKHHEIQLVITQPPRPAGRKRRLKSTPVADFSRNHGIPLLEAKDVNSPEVLERIRELNPEIAVVVAFGQFLKPSLLSSTKLGFFNVHASLLPKYRGAAPIQHALLDGVTETGVTLFKIDEGMDTGNIALSKRVKVDPYDTFDTLYERLSKIGSQLVKDFLDDPSTPLKPQFGESSRASKIFTEERFVDWNLPAENVGNKIRAFDSIPGAKSKLNGEVVKLFGFKGLSMTSKGKPGEVISLKGHALIACGEGGVMIERIQFPSKKVIAFSEAENGHKISRGSVFDS